MVKIKTAIFSILQPAVEMCSKLPFVWDVGAF